MNFILKNKDRNHTNDSVHTRNNLRFEDFNFNFKYTDNNYNVQKLFSFQLNINENNKNLFKNDNDYFLEDVSFFLADELQLCTLTKVSKIKRYFDNNNLKKEYIQWIDQIKNQLIPVPMGIKEESIEYNYMGLYNLLQYLPENKSVLIIKPIFTKNIQNNTLYLYQNIEPHLILNNKCQTTSVFNCIKVNESDQFNYDNVYDDGLKTYKIFNNDDFVLNKKNKNELYDFIYIKYIYIEKTKNKTKNELYSLNIFINQLFYSLQFLNKNGDLVIDISFLSYLLPNIQIIYFLKNIFEDMRFVKSDLYINDIDSGFFIFSNLKNKIDFNNKNLKINKNINKKYISSIFDNKLSNNFKNFLNKLYMTIFYKYEKYEQKKNFIKNELTIKPYSFQKYLDFMIEKSIKWSVSNKVPLNNIYLKFYDKKIPNNLKFKYFPLEKGVDLKKIKMTNESIYSVTFPKEANKISALIKKYFPKCKTVIDTSANVGGNTLSFSKYFKNVISIEIDLETKNALENNVNLYKRSNVDIILGDYTKLKNEFNTKYSEDETVYFFDPPWGGIYYKLEQVIDLYLSNINIIDLLPKNFVLKAPLNYNIQSVVKKYKNIQIYFLNNFIVLLPNYNISELELMDKGYYY